MISGYGGMRMGVLLPASLVVSGEGIPAVCSRHGRESTTASKCRFVSRPPRWAAALLLAGALPYLIVVTASRKRITAPCWPLCRACVLRRGALLLGGAGTLTISLGLFLLGAVLQARTDIDRDGHASVLPSWAGFGILLLFLAVLAFVAGTVITSAASTATLAGGAVTRDGMYVEFRDAAIPFVQWVTEFLNAGQPVGFAPPPHGCEPSLPPGQAQVAGYGQVQGPRWPAA